MKIAVFDLEIIKAPNSDWSNHKEMGISWGCSWDSVSDWIAHYDQGGISGLIRDLDEADLIISFNGEHFDFRLLEAIDPSFSRKNAKLKSYDLLVEIKRKIGRRVSLDSVAHSTLNRRKKPYSKTIPALYKEGRFAEIAEQCASDVALTRDLFLFIEENGYLMIEDKRISMQAPTPNACKAWTPQEAKQRHGFGLATSSQIKYIQSLYAKKGLEGWRPIPNLTKDGASNMIKSLKGGENEWAG